MAHYAVIGAGWAGLSAATRLLAAGHACTVFELAPQCGGRARRLIWNDASGAPLAVDNGQHILLGAYRETLALLALLGVAEAAVLQRLPLRLEGASGLRLRAPAWPAPLHLLAAIATARGLSWSERWAMTRFMLHVRRLRWRLAADCSVTTLLQATRQPPGLCRLLWEPLCIAALNTPAGKASAQVFVNVLRDSLGAGRAASDLLLPRVDLGAVLPDAAELYITRHGSLQRGTRVTAVRATARGLELDHAGHTSAFDGAVLAVPASEAARLLVTLPDCAAVAAACAALEYQSITTVYLRYAAGQGAALPAPMFALVEDPAHAAWGQWAFDRGALCATAGLIAVVISADGPHRDLSAAALISAVARQMHMQAGIDAPLLDARVIVEKRATFACRPGLQRPDGQTPQRTLVLAGDYCHADYPATLESAVASGHQAAKRLLN